MSKRVLYLGLNPSHYSSDGEMIHWPIIQIIPQPLSDLTLYETLKNFDRYTHLILTSKTTVSILHDYLPQLGINWQQQHHQTQLAVGQVTAKQLKASGIHPTHIDLEETAEGLIQLIQKLPLEDSPHFFWPHSLKARTVIKDFFNKEKIRFTECVLYDTQPQAAKEIPKLDDFDEIVFTSPSTVEAFIYFYGKLPTHLKLTPIGPITAACLINHCSI